MAKVEFKGIDEVELSFKELAELPDEVIDAMLNARADVALRHSAPRRVSLARSTATRVRRRTTPRA